MAMRYNYFFKCVHKCMFAKYFKKRLIAYLQKADIQINGERPWDLTLHNDRFFSDVALRGSLGLGESYMRGDFDCDRIDVLFERILRTHINAVSDHSAVTYVKEILALITNRQTATHAFEVGRKHYDIGNDLFQCMLDRRMTYSCGYWKGATDLDAAQEAKLDLICKKLSLKRGQKILDIGCGWGSFAKFAAENYGASVVGITISEKQLNLAKILCQGLPIELRLQDYREINERCDHIVSVGMFEHVGYKNYPIYMQVAARCLKEEGLFLLHTIGSRTSVKSGDPWTEKYIFPNGMLPSLTQISSASEKLFVIEDVHNFGAYYDTTLLAWYENFNRSWDQLKDHYSQTFYRMWRYYLLSCAGAARARHIELWQIILSKNGVKGGYQSVR